MISTHTWCCRAAAPRRVLTDGPLCAKKAIGLVLIAVLGLCSQIFATESVQPDSTTNRLFAFCYDTHDTEQRDLVRQAAMLREIGFDGAGHIGAENVAKRRQTLEAQQLQLFLIGTQIDLNNEQSPLSPTLAAALDEVKGAGVTLYVTIRGDSPSSPEGNKKAVPILRRLAQRADAAGVRVALYPHTGDWLVRVDHAVELVRQVDHQNLGIVFNLCHWMKNENLSQLESLLDRAGPHLFAVTINGADPAGIADPDWSRLIQPLDRGSFDVKRVVKLLRERHYKGPIGIMCYGIQEDAHQHLQRSFEQWRRWNEESGSSAIQDEK